MAGSPTGSAEKTRFRVKSVKSGDEKMPIFEALIAPIAAIIDKIIPDPKARDAAKLELLKLQGSQDLETLQTQLSAILAEAQSADPWTSRARPSFLYVMYLIILCSIPMGLIAAFRPQAAIDIAAGMNAYLAGLPEPLYALFGTGYLGYTAARQWGKVKGVEK
jgi:Holin of 3TMs, for gene-transfer release